MPLKRFWLFSDSIDRIRAEADLRELQNRAAVGSSEGIKARYDTLREEVGVVIEVDRIAIAKMDKDGFSELKLLSGR